MTQNSGAPDPNAAAAGAATMGANAIAGMRCGSSEIGQSLTEIAAYGTAVVIGPRR